LDRPGICALQKVYVTSRIPLPPGTDCLHPNQSTAFSSTNRVRCSIFCARLLIMLATNVYTRTGAFRAGGSRKNTKMIGEITENNKKKCFSEFRKKQNNPTTEVTTRSFDHLRPSFSLSLCRSLNSLVSGHFIYRSRNTHKKLKKEHASIGEKKKRRNVANNKHMYKTHNTSSIILHVPECKHGRLSQSTELLPPFWLAQPCLQSTLRACRPCSIAIRWTLK